MHVPKARSCPSARWTPCVFCIQVTDNSTTLPTIPYNMAVEYIKGETNFIADCLSRAPVAKDTIKLPILQVNQITAHARCTQDRIDRI